MTGREALDVIMLVIPKGKQLEAQKYVDMIKRELEIKYSILGGEIDHESKECD